MLQTLVGMFAVCETFGTRRGSGSHTTFHHITDPILRMLCEVSWPRLATTHSVQCLPHKQFMTVLRARVQGKYPKTMELVSRLERCAHGFNISAWRHGARGSLTPVSSTSKSNLVLQLVEVLKKSNVDTQTLVSSIVQ